MKFIEKRVGKILDVNASAVIIEYQDGNKQVIHHHEFLFEETLKKDKNKIAEFILDIKNENESLFSPRMIKYKLIINE